MPKEHPILFRGVMIRALLEGRKTQTRRLHGPLLAVQPGDRLWVRETFYPAVRVHWPELPHKINPADRRQVAFFSEGFDRSRSGMKGTPSIHMPRWASRILLEVSEVRRQLLQEITTADAIAEGATFVDRGLDAYGAELPGWTMNPPIKDRDLHASPRDAFASLWSTINREAKWRKNPEITAITFRVLEGL